VQRVRGVQREERSVTHHKRYSNMTEIQIDNAIVRFEIRAERMRYSSSLRDDVRMRWLGRTNGEIAAEMFSEYVFLVAERRRRAEAAQTAARIARGEA
jgi:hypothetical protein